MTTTATQTTVCDECEEDIVVYRDEDGPYIDCQYCGNFGYLI